MSAVMRLDHLWQTRSQFPIVHQAASKSILSHWTIIKQTLKTYWNDHTFRLFFIIIDCCSLAYLGKTLKPGVLPSYRGCTSQCIPSWPSQGRINGEGCIRKDIWCKSPCQITYAYHQICSDDPLWQPHSSCPSHCLNTRNYTVFFYWKRWICTSAHYETSWYPCWNSIDMDSSAPHLTWDVLKGKMLEIFVGSRRQTWAISRSKLHYLMQDVHRWHRVNRMSLFCLNNLLTLLQHQINVQMFFQFTANHLNVRSELCWVSKRLKGNLQWWFKKKQKTKCGLDIWQDSRVTSCQVDLAWTVTVTGK